MTAIVIIFAAILGAVMSVYLRKLSAGRAEELDQYSEDHETQNYYDPSNPQTTIIHQVPPESSDVKKLYEVFSWGREAMAEYLYYGEIDSSAVKEDGTGDLSKAEFHAEVSVSFEEDAINAEAANLRNYRRNGFKSPRFSIDNELGDESFCDLTPADISSGSNTADYENLIAISDQDYSQFLVVGPAHNICFRYTRVEPDRITSISVVAKGEFATMDWLYEHFNDLVERYQTLPKQRFEGAIRE